ncbi:MAG: prephenate dehydrogenase [Acetatifactor sp.]|nr:prephenate dehydrogenase [Acetatifactor sp.]
MSTTVCGFIGLGLIGGSIAKAIRSAHPEYEIIAYDVNTETLRLAKEDGVADRVLLEINEEFHNCDMIFLCAPVQKNDENLLLVKRYMKEGCLLTDVGSVKTTIHEAIHAAGLDHCFIGGHPMAGSERTGYINSKAKLLENAYYILTPTDAVSEDMVEKYRELVTDMNALPIILDYAKHDYITAAISHLPHVIAASLVNLVKDSDSEDGVMKMVAAGGFKDITRIASSSATMWQQICLTNTENISTLLNSYIESLQKFKDQIDTHQSEALYNTFDSAREYRDSFINASSGPIKRSFSFNVDIADEPGALAHIATLLAVNNISIKNIGITHNRESEDGVLRIEVYDEVSMNKAIDKLKAMNFVIYLKK